MSDKIMSPSPAMFKGKKKLEALVVNSKTDWEKISSDWENYENQEKEKIESV